MRLLLTQYVESSRSYTNTLLLLQYYRPSELCVVATKDALVSTGVNKATHSYHQVPLPRSCFDDSKGSLLASHYATADSKSSIEGAALHNSYYLALGAAGALLRYLEQEHSLVLAVASLNVEFTGTSNHMHIDSASVRALELIKPIKAGTPRCKSTSTSLFRLLKANLLQPLTDLATLSMRLDSVEELVQKEDMHFNITQCLEKFPKDLDRMCGNFGLRPQKAASAPARRISAIVQSMILLKETLHVVAALQDSVGPAESALLQAIHDNSGHAVFAELLQKVETVLDQDAHSAKASFLNTTEQCFAVKNGVDGFLDLSRGNFCRITEEIHQLADKLRRQHGMDWLKASYSARRGFYLVTAMPGHKTKSGAAVPPLPRTFIKMESKSKTTISCTTSELNALNARLRDASNDCLVLTQQVLEGAVAEVADHLGTLHKLLDNLSLLDMLCSFAHVAAASDGSYVRPRCTKHGPIAVMGGRHPILEQLEDQGFKANDTYIADCSSFLIVTGPNMSGKSTYLRQVALIVVMAQIGCFVPAKFASVRMVDRLFTRIGSSDSIETNCSSFMVEMQEAAYITNHATERSLVIIDELGRATCTADGIGISWAIAEHLISLGCFTLFATHFTRIAELASIYPNCKLWHLHVDTADNRLNFRWTLKSGPQEAGHYGLMLAPVVGIPDEITQEARRIAHRLSSREVKRVKQRSNQEHAELTSVYSLAHKIKCLADNWAEDPDKVDPAPQLELLQREAKLLTA
ncbi:hypothetical protein WJX72_002463 [[Myrmecia] bisecta]|uniref:DNA mismatch repair protein MSH4 n=1 Tax=[Myrmecia] bisecta TaxID=41462 RepID=A0AAW1PJI8_9CHLO